MGIKTDDQFVPTGETGSAPETDAERRLAELEAEKNKALEEAANYKMAFLKEKHKHRQEVNEDETEEERVNRLVQEELAQKKLEQIESEEKQLLQKLLKENKELKLANNNRAGTPPASVGGHSEGTPVRSTAITPEQLAAFKARGWSDKDIERYKQNLKRFI